MQNSLVIYCLLICGTFLVSQPIATAKTNAAVDFTRDIQPILAEHCNHCHGVDEASRQGGLRLDLQESALRGGDSGEPAIVPGSLDEGELLRRVTTSDPIEVMPPPDQHNPLSEQQIQLIKDWIQQGAAYESHWAFVTPRKLGGLEPGIHPIDAVVTRKLATMGLQLSPAEAPEVLCRRIYLDIIGLPPSLDEIAEFEREGLSHTIEKLLNSERYGEKWARVWLDAARYSDTNGYEKDLRREQWIWRDWVIRAFNIDMPYDQFIVEQVAGDLLPNPTQDQIIATGFLRNSMLNEEGAIVPEQFRMVEMFDRMDCIGKSILGLSTQCAQCHNHKFDPISQDEYYGIFAYLNDTYEAQSWVYDEEQLRKRSDVLAAIESVKLRAKDARPNWQAELATLAQTIAERQVEWSPIMFQQLEAISGLNHPVQANDGSILMLGHTSADIFYVGKHDLSGVTGLRLELLPHLDLPFNGPGRNGVGQWEILELEVFLKKPGGEWEKQQLQNASADYSNPERKTEDGKIASGPVQFLIDGNDANSWRSDRGIGKRNQASVAVVQFAAPLDCPQETEIKVVMRMGDMVGCCRISTTRSSAPVADRVNHQSVVAALRADEHRSGIDRDALFQAWLKSDPELESMAAEIENLLETLPQGFTSVLHTAKRSPLQARTTQLLERGEWDQGRDPVQPHVPAAFHPIDNTIEEPRLAFARWLVDRKSPLAARVAVNRVWQSIFGDGLVETSDDFGTRAPVPEHLELLDWLAVDFMENGWSHKNLIETILTSSVYQQSSAATSELLELDPRNRLLARGPRFRADAEVVRDIALNISGLINYKMGGPSVIPPVPQNVLDYNYTYPSYWTPATGAERYRRTVYGFRKRSMPDPVLSSFDAPNGDFSCVRRVRSNTPLAALTALNETVFFEAAQAFGLRILREGGNNDPSRAEYAFRLCTSRWPSPAEVETVLALLAKQRQRLADGWLNPREVATGDPARLPELPTDCTPQDAAAWTLVGRVLLNLDETLSKN